MIGFDGGRLARLATGRIWVDSHDYGIVESVHGFIAHLLVHTLATEAAGDGAVLASRSLPIEAVSLSHASGPTGCESAELPAMPPNGVPFERST